MSIFINLTGNKFGRLTVIERAPNRGKSSAWVCLCECGNKRVVFALALRSGDTKSCGCYMREIASENAIETNFKHGQAIHGKETSEYKAWQAAKYRCSNPDNGDYKNYGARGITMCAEWQNSFAAFFAHVGPRPAGLTLDRINNNLGYFPGNVRWATRKEQRNNQRPRSYKYSLERNRRGGEMSRLILRNDWKAVMEPKINSGEKVEYVGSFKPAIQWLIVNLLNAKRPYRIYNCGAGVQKITTETDVCPCCKRKLE